MPGTRSSERLLLNLFVLLLAAASQWPLFGGQFDGEDEAIQHHAVNRVLLAVENWRVPESLVEIVGILSLDPHPPLRHLLSLPGVALFPGTELGLRLGAIIVSLGMTWAAMSWGETLRGRAGRWIAGLFLATSGIYNWTSMAFGWSVIGTCVLVMFIQLWGASYDLDDPASRRLFHRMNLLCIVMFLTNTGCILFTVGLGLLYLRHNPLLRVVRASLRHVAFYAAYYLYFLVVAPAIYERLTGRHARVGQLRQNLGRAGETGLGLGALYANLAGLNAYLLPFVGGLLLGLGTYAIWRTRKDLLLVVGPYAVAWSVFLQHGSQQYFLLATLPLTIAGAVILFTHSGRSRVVRIATALGFVALLCSQVLWNWHAFIRPYTETTYPWASLRRVYARAERVHNIVQPYPELARDLERLLKPNERIVSEVSGGFFMFYYKDDSRRMYHSRFLRQLSDADFRPTPAGCVVLSAPADPSVRVVLSKRELCPDEYRARHQYPGSLINLYVR